MNIAFIRTSAIALHTYSAEHQIKSIQRAVGSSVEVVNSDRRRLIRQSISVRLEILGLLKLVQEGGHVIYIYDLSRLFSSLKEVKRGLAYFDEHNTVLKSVKERVDTSDKECRSVQQLNYIGEFLNTHALEKMASSINKTQYNKQGRPAKNCLLALNCIKSLRSGNTVTETAKKHNTTRDYIWRHCLAHPSVQLFYLGLTAEHIAAHTDEVYQEAMQLVRKIRLDKN